MFRVLALNIPAALRCPAHGESVFWTQKHLRIDLLSALKLLNIFGGVNVRVRVWDLTSIKHVGRD